MDMDEEDVKDAAKTFFAALIAFFLKCWIVMLVWNYFMPYVGVDVQLDYWHAMALQIMCGYLFQNQSYNKG